MKHAHLTKLDWQERFDHHKAVVFTESDFNAPGTKFQVVKFEPNTGIKPHYHRARTEAFVILAGAGTITIAGRAIRAGVGDMILCQPGDIHAFHNPGTVDFVVGVFRTNDPGDSDMIWYEEEAK